MKTGFHSAFRLQRFAFAMGATALITALPAAPAQTNWANAAELDGADDRVQTSGFGSFPSTAITVEFWMRSADTGRSGTPVSYATTASDNTFLISNYRNFQIYVAGLLTAPTGVSANDGQWHHIAATWSQGGGCYLYRDGVKVYQTNLATGSVLPSGGTLVLGQDQDSVGGGFDSTQAFLGQLDEVRIWNKVRSQSEIVANMLRTLTGTEPNLVAYWKFDEAAGATVPDSTSNQHSASLVNGAALVPSTVTAPNLVVNPGFEDGTQGWSGFGWATLAATNFAVHNGTKSGFVSNRTNTWCGVSQQFKDVLQPGHLYHLSAWVRLENSASDLAYMNFVKTDGTNTSYPGLASITASSNEWRQLSGNYILKVADSLNDLTLYLAGPSPGVNFDADDFVITQDSKMMPETSTLLAGDLGATDTMVHATLNGTVIPNGFPTTSWFEWGTTTGYGSSTVTTNVGNSFDTVAFSQHLGDLAIGTTYHYRAVATNEAGVAYGIDRTFGIAVVTNLADSGAGSLRQQIADAGNVSVLLITNTGTITLTSGELVINKAMTIIGPGANNLSVSGNNGSRVFNVASNVTVSISGLTIRDGQSANGSPGTTWGAAGLPGAPGGGIYNAGLLTLSDCVITNNVGGRGGDGMQGQDDQDPMTGGQGGIGSLGGGIYNHLSGSLALQRCTVTGNMSGNGGNAGRGNVGRETIVDGFDGGGGGAGGPGGAGGGIYSAGILTLDACLISGNLCGAGGAGGAGGRGGDPGFFGDVAGDGGWGGTGGRGGVGGGITTVSEVTLVNCTFSDNRSGRGATGGNGGQGGREGNGGEPGSNGGPGAGGGGGAAGAICTGGNLELVNCTVTHNAAGTNGLGGTWPYTGPVGSVGSAGGITNTGAASLVNTIVAKNIKLPNIADDVRGIFNSLGHNLVGVTNGAAGFGATGDLLNMDPLLGPLTDNGGPTLTHALFQESPAVNAGDNTYAPATDQRGVSRCGTVDIGAFEVEFSEPPTLVLLGDNPLVHERGLPFVDPGATAVDVCGTDLTASIMSILTVNPAVPGCYTNTFLVVDAGSNLIIARRTVVVVTRPVLTGLEQPGDGSFRCTFTNTPGAPFDVLATTNLALPFNDWTVLGPAVEGPPGQFQFTDPAATNSAQRFYRVRSP